MTLKDRILALDDLIQSAVGTKTVEWLFHAALFATSVYVTANPEYSWIVPLLQGSGQMINSPRNIVK